MEFTHYTDGPIQLARDLVNFHVDAHSAPEFGAFLDEYDFTHGELGARELNASRALAERLRAIFEASDVDAAADLLNELLGEAKIEPRLDTHGGRGPHFHYASPELPVITRLHAFTAMGLAMVVAMGDHERLGVCDAVDCSDTYIDTSKNMQRRFCSSTCSTRVNVKAYRARQKPAVEA